MTSSRHILITQLLACAAAGVASVGCGTSATALRAPLQAFDVAAADVVAAADAPQQKWLGARCTVDDEPRILAKKIAPNAGVTAQADASRVLVRFTHQRSREALALSVDPQSLEAFDDSAAAAPRLAEQDRGESLSGQTLPVLWQPPPDVDRVEPPVVTDSGDARVSRPVVAPVDSERSVVVWNAGSIYTGEDVHVMMVDRHGNSIGAPVTLATDGRAFGTPTVAVGPSGRGVVAFLQSGDHGFELVAVSLDCHVTAAPETTAAWAMQTAP
jgi:hypothetical protein